MADEVFARRWVRIPSGPHVAYAVGGGEELPALALLPSWMSNIDVLLRQVHIRRLVDSRESIASAALFVAGLGSLTGFHAAATAPDRVDHLILWNSTPCLAGADDLPVGKSDQERRAFLEEIEDWWGTSDDRVLVDDDESQARQATTFTDRGRHQLKGIEGEWRLFAAE